MNDNAKHQKKEEVLPIAGPRFTVLALLSLVFCALFMIIVMALILADFYYLSQQKESFRELFELFMAPNVLRSMKLSFVTSLSTLFIVVVFSIPIGYALSHYRFPGHAILNTIVDVPLILPPVVIGISLLAFFGTPLGVSIKEGLRGMNISLISGLGIVMCQFIVSIPYCVRATKTSFDSVNRDLENVALSLGCSQWQAFRHVVLPLAKNGLVAGAVMAWARAIGVFGPLMVFVGTGPRVQVMPTSMWLELSIGNIEVSLAFALIMLLISGTALLIVHVLSPGKRWC